MRKLDYDEIIAYYCKTGKPILCPIVYCLEEFTNDSPEELHKNITEHVKTLHENFDENKIQVFIKSAHAELYTYNFKLTSSSLLKQTISTKKDLIRQLEKIDPKELTAIFKNFQDLL